MKKFVYNIFAELTRKANNGELFNKNTNRESKDNLTVFFWRIAKKFDTTI